MCACVCVLYDQREVLSREEEILRKTVERGDDGTLLHESRGRAICEERKRTGQSGPADGQLGEGNKLGQSIKPYV